MYSITITNQQDEYPVNESLIHDAVQTALKIHGVVKAVMDVAILDPEEMQKVNARHLGHDYPADVLSFLLEETRGSGLPGGCQRVVEKVRLGTGK